MKKQVHVVACLQVAAVATVAHDGPQQCPKLTNETKASNSITGRSPWLSPMFASKLRLKVFLQPTHNMVKRRPSRFVKGSVSTTQHHGLAPQAMPEYRNLDTQSAVLGLPTIAESDVTRLHLAGIDVCLEKSFIRMASPCP